MRLVLHRPPLNYLDLESLQEFDALIQSMGDKPDCRALVIESEGKAFSAGLDVAELTRERVFLLLEQFHRVAGSVLSFARPTIAVVRGIALGAGNELAACCDFVFASETASFGQPEIKFGSIPSLAPLILPPLIGTRRTLEMILTGDLIPAKEAQRIGLTYSVAPEDKLADSVETLIGRFRRLSLPIMELALEASRGARARAIEDSLRDAESLYLNRLMDVEDCAEGAQAFLEKRAPNWQNR